MHIPVLQKEVLEFLSPKADENFIDATIGGGGHAFEILKHTAPNGKLLGIDVNLAAIEDLKEKIKNEEIKNRLILICGNFSNLQNIVRDFNFNSVRGVLADLGFSSGEIETSGRGFSFLRDEPLDMRYGKNELTAEKIINNWSDQDLTKIFREYGEERFADKIAAAIVRDRKTKRIETTFELVRIIRQSTPYFYHRRRLHPATKVFQALRIAVNDELNNLNKFLPQVLDVLVSGGRLAIISFHSLEDRIVKNFLKEKKREGLIEILTKKVTRPRHEEIAQNPRARSAKLRAAIKI
ncbi:MAG: 16S rRNA (cytosine(1402)-N(4))-methyltransferase [Parcubacteria group bacterium CG1_02_40_82]|uniref:Ribosomal RNA small subunit methyltransferase H n=1 Tax=Candidatus Portnoybacteria bacterium CG_4_9_14_3_um_filter_40_10 TaxID=1974804 RepID=A0A2M7YMH8_9BACT|nr:MAG: 16S rRNA (cytosine(1402)-N(4))-methyltransferase [Parcubacteria group bacterium CG1_02_40_82]PJA64185.1 MAG: 16S rRNA (cytosine(1402)-N(4))-methyltransferase [Candidatus Portnoybacteria bacterium CG_4_9_14_3_um_filter_40_10]